jgi:hypothetical protein
VFPVIVIEGELFEAYYDPGVGDMKLHPVHDARLHWQGANLDTQWVWTVDVVKFDALPGFIAKRKAEMQKLWAEIDLIIPKLARCYEEGSLMPLNILDADRGYAGTPKILRELEKAERNKEKSAVPVAPSEATVSLPELSSRGISPRQ